MRFPEHAVVAAILIPLLLAPVHLQADAGTKGSILGTMTNCEGASSSRTCRSKSWRQADANSDDSIAATEAERLFEAFFIELRSKGLVRGTDNHGELLPRTAFPSFLVNGAFSDLDANSDERISWEEISDNSAEKVLLSLIAFQSMRKPWRDINPAQKITATVLACPADRFLTICENASWQTADFNHNGNLSPQEISDYWQALYAVMSALDKTGTLKPFENVFHASTTATAVTKNVIAAYDHNGDGEVSNGEFYLVRKSNKLISLLGAMKPITNEPGLYLRIENTRAMREMKDGREYLVVSGSVRNLSNQLIAVPKVQVKLLDGAGVNVRDHVTDPSIADLAGGKETTFKAHIIAPPSTARKIKIEFSE